MQGQHNSLLQEFYEQCIHKAKEYLESRYLLETCSKTDKDYPENLTSESCIVWKIVVQNDLRPLTCIIALPNTFPDELPKIYLSRRDYLEIAPIPHLDNNRFFCTRDPNVVSVNEDKPGEAIEELLQIATEEIIRGIRKENTEDFLDEFLAYWNDDAKYKILSSIKPGPNIEKLKIMNFKEKFLGCNYLLARSEQEAQKWLSHVEIAVDTDSTCDSLYLPLEGPVQIPNRNLDYYKIIKEAGKKYLLSIEKYFKKKNKGLFIFFSFPLKGERILAGWKQTVPKKIAGFRPGKDPLDMKFIKSGIQKIQIIRVDRERLFRRGGTGISPSISDKALAIIGCGSLGGSLTVTLSKTGISNFLVVDNELLEEENVPRHECGFMEAGNKLSKSFAIKRRITSHFPHIDCKDCHDDILALLRKEETLLNNYDMVIVAIAKMSIERRLNSLLRQGIITAPLLFVWLEPLGVAGHMLYIHPNEGGCYQCCLKDNGEFRYSVVKPNQHFNKTETGCQSTFLEYSNLDMQHFMIIVSRAIVALLEDVPQFSILHTWLGDLSLFKSLGYEISDDWFADTSFSVHKRIIQRNGKCEICQSR